MSTSPNDFNARIIDEFRANGGEVGEPFANTPLLLLHHAGAKSGIERVNPLAYLRDGNRYVIFASKAGAPTNPDWYHNLRAHPEVRIEVGDGHAQRGRRRGDGRRARAAVPRPGRALAGVCRLPAQNPARHSGHRAHAERLTGPVRRAPPSPGPRPSGARQASATVARASAERRAASRTRSAATASAGSTGGGPPVRSASASSA